MWIIIGLVCGLPYNFSPSQVDSCNFMYHTILKQTEEACATQMLETKKDFQVPDGAYWSDLKCVKLLKGKLL